MKKVFSLLLSITIIVSTLLCVDLSAYALMNSGKCGDNITWEYDSKSYTLTLTGYGNMYNYRSSAVVPWRNNWGINELIISEGITSIGSNAFHSGENIYMNIKELTIPNSVKSIEAFAFADCNSLKKVVLNNGVEYIGEQAFYSCSNIVEFDFGNSLIEIGEGSFGNCGFDVKLPDSLKIIGKAAFISCSFKEINIPDSVTTIDYGAFEECSYLQNITLSENLNSIAEYVFYKCRKLNNIIIPKNVENIGDYAFGNCRSLNQIVVPENVKNIGEYVFWNCNNLSSITIPNSVVHIGEGAFDECYSMENVYFEGTVDQWAQIDFVDYYSNPFAVTNFYEHNFYINKKLAKEINLISTKKINDYSFENFVSLEKVELNDCVTQIGKYAFSGCENIEEMYLSNNIDYVDDFAFCNCQKIEELNLGNSIRRIGQYAMSDMESLKKITIPISLRYISEKAFNYCWALKDVYYNGSKSEWNKITICDYNDCLTNATIHYNTNVCNNLTTQLDLYSSEFASIINKPIFSNFKKSLYKNEYIVIPGIDQTNVGNSELCRTMTPQGACVAGKYVLVSSYDGCKRYFSEMNKAVPAKSKSVIYVIDEKTGNYICTLVYYNTAHLGGLAYNDKNKVIYIANGENVDELPLSFIDNAVHSGSDAVTVKSSDVKSHSINMTASFLTYYDSKLYVGYCKESNNPLTDILTYGKLVRFNTNTFENEHTDVIPVNAQGAVFFKHGNATYMLLSTSYGRTNTADIKMYLTAKKDSGYVLLGKFGTVTFPDMTENIFMKGDKICALYESAAACYQNNNSSKGKCKNPVCRITENSKDKLLKNYSIFALDDEDDESFTIASGKCGDNLYYSFYSDGMLQINGQGSMYDYDIENAPWSDYSDYIIAVYFDTDVTYIGRNAFADCQQLELVDIPEQEESVEIAENAFASCSALEIIHLPSNDCVIEDAFSDISVDAVFESDSVTVQKYAESNGWSIHKHNFVYDSTVTATCSENGYELYMCDCGEQRIENIIEATGEHDYVETNRINPTCTESGVINYECSKCGEKDFDELEPKHTVVDEPAVEPTCTAIGLTKGSYCSVCDEIIVESEEIQPLGHNYENFVCTRCGNTLSVICLGETKNVAIEKEGDILVLCFAPEESGTYTFESFGDFDTMVWLYDENDNQIGYNDDNGDDINFSLTHQYESGKTYRFEIKFYDEEELGSFVVKMSASHTHSYIATVTTATCIQEGYTTYTCSCGDSYIANLTEKTPHSPVSVNNAVAATCTADGKESDTKCSVCGVTLTTGSTIKALGHKWNSGVVTKQPTETSTGIKTYTCTRSGCGATKTEVIPVLAHTHNYIATVTTATCIQEGYTTYTCSCGDSYIANLTEKTPHTPVSVNNAVAATCTTDGKESDTKCSVCGVTLTTGSTIKALGHKWNSGVVTKQPTETSTGIKTYTCTRSGCGATKTEVIPMLTHTHSYTAVVTAPTCTQQGYTTYTCACGDSYIDNFVAKTDHKSVSANNAVAATCTTDGKKSDTKCSVCGVTLATGEKVAALGHKWNSGVVTKQPTETSTGIKTYTCTRSGCGATKTEVIPMLTHTHSYTAVVTAPTCTQQGYTTYTCACGDSYIDNFVAKIDHKSVSANNAVAATCTTDGKKSDTKCSVCGVTLTTGAKIKALGHNYKNGICSRCGALEGYGVGDEDEITVINLNRPLTYPSYPDNEKHRIAFTPEKTGHYFFDINSTTCDEGANVEIKDSKGKLIGDGYGIPAGCTVEFYASAGSTYYITVNYQNSNKHIGESFVLEVRFFSAEHSYLYSVKKATLTENGTKTGKCSCGVKSRSTIYYPKTISLSTKTYTYDGKAKKPTVKVVDSNGKTISSSNYTLTYSNNKNVGKASVKITFNGNYAGVKTLYFTIKPKGTTISSLTASSKGFTAKWKKQATQTTGYQIQYSTSSKFTNAKTVTVSKNSTTSKKVSKLTAKKKYYVRIRTYKTVSGTKYYSSWSGAKSVTTKK